jgi:L-fuculose-phosphate aldolase
MSFDHTAMRQAVIDTACALQAAGLIVGTAGNVSVRCDEGFLVTPSGMPYDELQTTDIVAIDHNGTAHGCRIPSSEWRIHRDVYAQRNEAGAVVHTHSPFATALACQRRDVPAFHYMVARFGGANVRCCGYATFGTQALSGQVLAALSGRTACLMANHGMLVFGRELKHARLLAAELEALCEQYWRALQAGPPALLDDAQIIEALSAFANFGQE